MKRPFERALGPLALAATLFLLDAPVHAQTTNPPTTVTVKAYTVTGNTLLPAATIDAALAPYLGDRSLDELRQAALVVQGLYRDAGYGAVVAFLPEQTATGGQVLITVLEGKLSKITVTGQQRHSEANVRASLPGLRLGETPKVREIDAQIQLANENPGKTVDVLLQPGGSAGTVEALVEVNEQAASRWTLGLDNTGNENTGRLRASVGFQRSSLWDLDHVLSMQYQMAPEKPSSVAVLSANYRVPLYNLGMALDAYAAYSDVDGGTTGTAAGPLQFTGKGRIAGLRLSRYLPRVGEIDQRVVVGLDHRDYINNCAILGLPAGACGGAGESVSVQPVSVEYIVQKGGENAFGASIGLQHNLQIGGGHSSDANFQLVRPGAQPRYTLVRLSFYRQFPVAEQWQMQARVVGQLSPHGLVSGEQFGIGGGASVRGYEERELTGDSGASASIELRSPELAALVGLGQGSLRAIGFFDAGWVSNRLDTPCRLLAVECKVASAGVGLRYAMGPWQARLDLAHALSDGTTTGRHDTRAHFQVSYSF